MDSAVPIADPIKGAWIAAAYIASQKGYPLAATLVIYSVLGQNYSEVNGAFATKIKGTSLYPSIIKTRVGSDVFTRNIDSDLFYALHKFDYHSASSSRGMRLWVTDTFDFQLNTSHQDLFSTCVNNWAFLCQHTHILTPINVNIDIDV